MRILKAEKGPVHCPCRFLMFFVITWYVIPFMDQSECMETLRSYPFIYEQVQTALSSSLLHLISLYWTLFCILLPGALLPQCCSAHELTMASYCFKCNVHTSRISVNSNDSFLAHFSLLLHKLFHPNKASHFLSSSSYLFSECFPVCSPSTPSLRFFQCSY